MSGRYRYKNTGLKRKRERYRENDTLVDEEMKQREWKIRSKVEGVNEIKIKEK